MNATLKSWGQEWTERSKTNYMSTKQLCTNAVPQKLLNLSKRKFHTLFRSVWNMSMAFHGCSSHGGRELPIYLPDPSTRGEAYILITPTHMFASATRPRFDSSHCWKALHKRNILWLSELQLAAGKGLVLTVCGRNMAQLCIRYTHACQIVFGYGQMSSRNSCHCI